MVKYVKLYRRVAGVRISEERFWSWLVPEVRNRVLDWVYHGARWGPGPEPARITQARVEAKARCELAACLSVLAGKPVNISNRAWKLWRDIVTPSISEVDRAIMQASEVSNI